MDSVSQERDDEQQLKRSTSGGGERENVVVQEEGEAVRGSPATAASSTSYIGKHRLAAAVASLNHQIQIIQEELDGLETLGQSSLACEELVSTIESIPDALLPVSRGPANVDWDRWFQGASRSRKRWI